MVKITLDAAVTVTSGPVLPLGSVLEPDSYSVATVDLAPKDAADGGDRAEIPLLPAESDVVLLGVRARAAEGGKAATVTLTPKNGEQPGAEISVRGALVVASRDVLAQLVAGGPRTLALANIENAEVTVDILAALQAPKV